MTNEEQAAIASDKLADAMIAAADAGVPDEIIGNEVVKLALTIIQAAQGGRCEAVAVVLRNIADHIETNPEAPVTIN
tara:strand:- start:1531 stop:1761 length:231 start_codon:yes stop_codon:yes gene_type:complete